MPVGGALLDAGAGSGEYARTVYAQHFARLILIERNSRNLGILRSSLSGSGINAHIVDGSISNMPVPSGSVSCVAATQVLEHVEDDESVVLEFGRVLAPDGYALITVPFPSSPWPEPEHRRDGYTRAALRDLFFRAGLHLIHDDYFLTGRTQRVVKMAHRFFLGCAPRLLRLSELELSRAERRNSSPYGLLALFQKGKP